MNGYEALSHAVSSEALAVSPHALAAIVDVLRLKAVGQAPARNVLTQMKAAATEAAVRAQLASQSTGGAVAVLSLSGFIMQRGYWGTSVDRFTQQFRQAANDPTVKAIVIDIDSPGGCVSGVPELAAEILATRKSSGKKIIALSNSLCASAAYFIASACSEVVVTPSSLTGSIGVYTAHMDVSKALEMAGVAITLVSYGAHKVDGNPYEPLKDDARADMQDRVTFYGVMFETAVAKGRKKPLATVQANFGQGKVFNAQKAVSSGMADSVATLDEVLGRFGVSRNPESSVGGYSSQAAKALEAEDCTCDCDSCEDGDCDNCTTDDCDFAGCTCDAAKENVAKKAKAAATAMQHAHLDLDLKLLGV